MLHRSKANQCVARKRGVGLAQSFALSILGLSSPALISATPIEVAQLNPNPSIFNEPPFNRVPRSPQVPDQSPSTPAPPSTSPLPAPAAVMTLVNGQVNIRFVNETGAVIDYQVIGTTESRTLAGRSEIALQGLTTPTTLTFRRQDSGFLQATLAENQPEAGTLTLTVQETPDFAVDRTSLSIDTAGGIFLN